MNRLTYLILGLVFLISVKDIFVNGKHAEDDHDEFKEFGDDSTEDGNKFSEGTEDDHIEVREQSAFTKPKSIVGVDLPPMRFLFCVSCGYRQAFDQFSAFIRDRYPEMQIEGGNYPPAPWKTYVAQGINILKMAAIMIVITGRNPFESMGLGTPGILTWAQGNKLSACMMMFLLSNMVENSLMSTGAFEIYVGDELIWSKLESGRVPSPQELGQMIDSQLALLGKAPATATGFGDFEAN